MQRLVSLQPAGCYGCLSAHVLLSAARQSCCSLQGPVGSASVQPWQELWLFAGLLGYPASARSRKRSCVCSSCMCKGIAQVRLLSL